VPLQLFGRTADARSAYDGAHSFGDLDTIERLTQLLAVLAFDSPRNTACAGVVRHEDEEASCEADERRERRALVAALFLLDLDDELLAFLEELTIMGAPRAVGQRLEVFLGHVL